MKTEKKNPKEDQRHQASGKENKTGKQNQQTGVMEKKPVSKGKKTDDKEDDYIDEEPKDQDLAREDEDEDDDTKADEYSRRKK